MKLRMKIAVVAGALALATAPASALATGQPEDPGSQGKGKGPHYVPETPEQAQPGPHATLPEKAKAYGVYCKDQSRKHVKGEKGTPFSQCVTAMAKATAHENLTPRQACKELSRKHVKGEKGTPFSRCVVAAAQLKEDQEAPEEGQS